MIQARVGLRGRILCSSEENHFTTVAFKYSKRRAGFARFDAVMVALDQDFVSARLSSSLFSTRLQAC